MRTKQGVIGTIILIILVGIAILYIGENYTGLFIKAPASSISAPSHTGTASQPVKVTYSNMEQVLASNPIVQALPSNGIIWLRFYNFNTGTRQWEKSYVLTKASAKEGTATKPDITIVIHSKYISQMTTSNFCSIIQTAKQNGDLGTELGISKLSLMWKYKSIMSYRSCLGF